MSTTAIIGIDAAAQPDRTGGALAEYDGEALVVRKLRAGLRPAEVAGWLPKHPRVLICVDAPLGWPAPLGDALAHHEAGGPLVPDAHDLFRRTTDRVVYRATGKTPLDVGADRIARAAHGALRFITQVRSSTGLALPLAWTCGPVGEPSIIEVYPGATLKVLGIAAAGYRVRGDEGRAARRCVIEALKKRRVDFGDEWDVAVDSPDALDAVVCAFTGTRFLDGTCVPIGPHATVARREGWIWFPSGAG